MIHVASIAQVAIPARCPEFCFHEPFHQALEDGRRFRGCRHDTAQVKIYNCDAVFRRTSSETALEYLFQQGECCAELFEEVYQAAFVYCDDPRRILGPG